LRHCWSVHSKDPFPNYNSNDFCVQKILTF
jgi:hypothetical protein